MCAWPSRSVLLTHTHQHALLHASFGFLPFLGALCRIGTSTRAWLFASHSHTVVRASGFRLGISAFPRYTRAVFPLPSQGLCRVWPVRSFLRLGPFGAWLLYLTFSCARARADDSVCPACIHQVECCEFYSCCDCTLACPTRAYVGHGVGLIGSPRVR